VVSLESLYDNNNNNNNYYYYALSGLKTKLKTRTNACWPHFIIGVCVNKEGTVGLLQILNITKCDFVTVILKLLISMLRILRCLISISSIGMMLFPL